MSNKMNVAINGFGRIGRAFFRMSHEHSDYEVVAINDLGNLDNLAYLLEYDTMYGRTPYEVEVKNGNLVVDGKEISYLSEKDPLQLPWKDKDIDIVVESTGVFTSFEKAKVHLEAGAKRVVISAPVKGEEDSEIGKTVLMGVNASDLSACSVSSNASCTTNAVSPLVAILHDEIGIDKAILNTVHAYTATQSLIDGPTRKSNLRLGRAAAQNIIPSSTGAAIATTLVHTDLKDKFDGISLRVPVAVGSLVDVTFVTKKDTTVEEVNGALQRAAQSDTWKNLFAVTEEPLVSSDIIDAHYAAIADLQMTRVVGGNLVKVLAWYDNETSYTHTLIAHVEELVRLLK
jgi:glyceraldehyde 3-phosphate dehydrogenase